MKDTELIEMLKMLQEKFGFNTEKSIAAIEAFRKEFGVDDVGELLDEILKEHSNGKS